MSTSSPIIFGRQRGEGMWQMGKNGRNHDVVSLKKKRCREITLQGTNISPKKWHFEDDFPFPVWWDMLISWRIEKLGKDTFPLQNCGEIMLVNQALIQPL